ncbi:MAG: MFS transporter [Chloroflexales bacterium]|nr:MFS transporter [Chloroflexales bacterium]
MVESESAGAATSRDVQRLVLVGLMFAGFISLGLPDGLLGVAWPSMAASRGVGLDALGSLLIAFSAGFLAVSVLSGRLLARLGVGVLLASCCLATALSLIGFALAPAWWMLFPLAVLLGAGGGAIDAGLNNYAAATTTPRVLTWLHACYGLGATAGPMIMTSLLSGGRPWQLGYLIVGCGQLALALCFFLTRGRWAAAAPVTTHDVRSQVGLRATLSLPAVWLGVALFALYTGLEVSAGQWTYTLFTVGRGIEPATAGQWVGFYWAGLTVGRFVAGAVAGRLTPRALLWIGSLGAVAGATLLGLVAAPWASVTGMVLMGASLAPIFPALIGTTAERVGRLHAGNAIGLQVASANIGAALIPWGVGRAVTGLSVAAIGPAIVVVALAYLALFVAAMRARAS